MNIKNGQKVSVHYVGTLNNGTEFDSSRSRGEPISFEFGGGAVLPAFETAVAKMTIGEKKKISLKASEAYGERKEQAIQEFPKTSFGPEVELTLGNIVKGRTAQGADVSAIISEIKEEHIVLDFNHPLAGKDINFDIELVSVE